MAHENGFPERLRTLRNERQLSQAQLAKQIGVHLNQIGRYERGASRPSADALKRLADVLDVSADFLIDGTIEEAAESRFDDRELLRQFQEVQRLGERDKKLVKEFLGAFLTKKRLEEMVAG